MTVVEMYDYGTVMRDKFDELQLVMVLVSSKPIGKHPLML